MIVGNVKTKVVIGGKDNLLGIDLMKHLREYLRLRPTGYHRSPAYKKGRWDGWRYFITPAGVFPTGFVELVASYMEELGAEVIIEDTREGLPRLKEKLDNRIGVIDGKEWEGFDYQMSMISRLNNYIKAGSENMYFPRGIYDCATNAGKNSIAALIVKNLDKKYNTAFIVSNEGIFRQAVSFFSQVIGEPVGEIKSGKYKPSWFTVIMVRTMRNRAKEAINAKKYLNDLDVLIVDESDEAGSKEYATVLAMVGAGMRIFLSGTPLEAAPENNMAAIGLSGKVLGKISNKFLIDNGYSQRTVINMLLNITPFEPADYDTEKVRNIHLSHNRVNLIIDEVLKKHPDDSILITFKEMEHGYFMLEQIQEQLPELSIDIAHGTSADKMGTLERFKNREVRVLLASMIVKKGLNIPAIEVLVSAQGGQSVIEVKQILGRGLRKKEHDRPLQVYDFYDTGKYVSKHSAKRARIYKKDEFEVVYNFDQKRGHPVRELLEF